MQANPGQTLIRKSAAETLNPNPKKKKERVKKIFATVTVHYFFLLFNRYVSW